MAKSMWARGPEWTFTAFCRTETVSTFSLRPRGRCEWARSSCRTGLSYSPHSCFVLAIRPQRILIVARLEPWMHGLCLGGPRKIAGRTRLDPTAAVFEAQLFTKSEGGSIDVIN